MCSRGSRRGSTRIAAPSKRNSANARRPFKVRAKSEIPNLRMFATKNFRMVFSHHLLNLIFSPLQIAFRFVTVPSVQSTFARAAAASPRSPPRAVTLFPLRPRPRPRPPCRFIIIRSRHRRRCPLSGCQCCRRITPSTAAGAHPRNSGIALHRQ